MAMTATCMTIKTVQMPPKRRPPPPGPDCLRRVPMPRVTLSPGRSPAIAAATSVSSAAYTRVLGETLECIQNGTRFSNMFSVTMANSECQASCANVTATSAATIASTNASTNSWPDDPPAAGAERRSHEDLVLARRGPGEHQQRDVAADEKHEQDTQQVAPEHFRDAVCRKPAEDRIDVGHDPGLEMLVGVGKRGGSRGAEDRQFRLRGFERGARRQSAEYPHDGALLPWVVHGFNLRGTQKPCARGKRKPSGITPTMVWGTLPRRSSLPMTLRVGRESRLPDVVSDHDDPRRAGLLIGLDQWPAKNGALLHDTKRGRADLRHGDRLRRGIADDHVPVAVTIRRKVLNGRQGVAPRHEVMKGRRSFTATGGVDHHDPDNPRAAFKRQPGVHDLGVELEGDDAAPDREGHRDRPHDRQADVLDEQPQGEPDVQ